MKMMTADHAAALQGCEVYDQAGDKIGKVEDFYYDSDTNQPEWFGVSGGLFGTKHTLIPIEGMQESNDRITVPYTKDLVKSTPDIDDDELSVEREQELYEHYGLRYQMSRGQTSMESRESTMPRTTGDGRTSMTRSEEELRVGKREVPAGTARLRKWVEKKPVQENVTLRQERAYVEREPIDRPVSGAKLGEKQVEMNLRREEPVVEKNTVAKERVSLRKESEEENRTIRGEVREEHIESDGAIGRDRPLGR